MSTFNEYFYGLATSIKERAEIFKDIFPKDKTLSSLKTWRNRKTLLNDADFNNMLRELNLSFEEFDLAVSELTDKKIRFLYSYVKEQEWYKLHTSLFHYDLPCRELDIDTSLRFHVHYFIKEITKYVKNTTITISENALHNWANKLKNDLLSISKPTLVWDVHDIKERYNIDLNDPKKEFISYLESRFGDSRSTKQFFLEYPALSRLLATRLSYAITNFKLFIDSLVESSQQLSINFNLKEPYLISEVHCQSSDSHNGGKSIVIFAINQKKLVYKYHSNETLVFFNKFIKLLNEISPHFSLYSLKCISSPSYSIEEFVEYKSCNTIEEIQNYYYKYGILVALSHFLGATDLHMENLIAHGNTPVLIDVETLFLAEERRIYSNEYTKARFMEINSVIISGLLPMHRYWKRQLDFSALNGVRQKLPYKVRRLINTQSSDIIFKLEETYLEPSKNVPMLNNKAITFNDYSPEIENGYLDTMQLLIEHRKLIINFIYQNLNNCKVRVLLRDTQDYSNFLGYSNHPSCMSDYIEHEKVLENLWNHSFITNNVVKYEVEALSCCDIPYFFTYVSSFNLHTNEVILHDFFSKNMKQLLFEHINKISEKQIDFSLLLINEALDSIKSEYKAIPIIRRSEHPSKLISFALDIKEYIMENIFFDSNNNLVIWPELENVDAITSYSIKYPDSNFYDGTAGLFTFLYALKYYTGEDNKILLILENEIFSGTPSSNIISAFYGYGARILSAYILFKLTGEQKFNEYMNNNIEFLLNICLENVSWEWLNGVASLVCLLCRISVNTDNKNANLLLHKIISTLNINYINNSMGFAHGIAGTLYSLIEANKLIKDDSIDNLIFEFYKRLSFSEKIANTSWFNGSLGINKAIQTFLTYHAGIINSNATINPVFNRSNSCISNGMYGSINYFIEKFKSKHYTDNEKTNFIDKLINQPICLNSFHNFCPLGLFNGLSGIGYQLLRLYDTTLFDILFF